jgi:hypothetical protein
MFLEKTMHYSIIESKSIDVSIIAVACAFLRFFMCTFNLAADILFPALRAHHSGLCPSLSLEKESTSLCATTALLRYSVECHASAAHDSGVRPELSLELAFTSSRLRSCLMASFLSHSPGEPAAHDSGVRPSLSSLG